MTARHRIALEALNAALSADPHGCVLWPLSPDSYGYGRISIGGRRRIVTHAVLEMAGCPRPPRGHALHSCDTPACINPRHLRWGTHQENMQDMSERGRSPVTREVVRSIRARAAAGETGQSIAADLGIDKSTACRIITRKTWGNIE